MGDWEVRLVKRREFFKSSPLVPLGAATTLGMLSNTEVEASPRPPPLPFQSEKSNLQDYKRQDGHSTAEKANSVLLANAWDVGVRRRSGKPHVDLAKYKARRESFAPHDLGPKAVEITTDKKGDPILDLQQNNFRVYEDDKEQTVTGFSRAPASSPGMDADGKNQRKVSNIDASPYPGRTTWQPVPCDPARKGE
jgi:hypothetical protein